MIGKFLATFRQCAEMMHFFNAVTDANEGTLALNVITWPFSVDAYTVQKKKKQNTAVVIGEVLGGIAILGVVVAILIIYRQETEATKNNTPVHRLPFANQTGLEEENANKG